MIKPAIALCIDFILSLQNINEPKYNYLDSFYNQDDTNMN